MSREGNVFEDIIEQKLLNLHTGFIAKIISIKENTATIQPLSLYKQVGKEKAKQAVISDVPIGHNARFKLAWESYNEGKRLTATPILVGDTVYCLCADRDITKTKTGVFDVPQIGHHEINDAVIICVLD